MKVWQGCLIALAAFALLIGVLVAVVFYATSGVTDTADEFFEAANEGDYERAFNLTSQQLQRGSSVEGLEEYILQYGLNEVVDTSWSSRKIENNSGSVSGTLTTASGGEIPAELEFVYENEEWKISFIDVQAAGLQGGGGSAAAPPEPMVLPSPDDQESLLFFAGAGFVNALEDGDYSDWQKRFIDDITVSDLEENFSAFAPDEPALRRAVGAGPNFEPATSLNANGDLELEGTYSSGGTTLRFRYIFTGEGDQTPKISFADYNIE